MSRVQLRYSRFANTISCLPTANSDTEVFHERLCIRYRQRKSKLIGNVCTDAQMRVLFFLSDLMLLPVLPTRQQHCSKTLTADPSCRYATGPHSRRSDLVCSYITSLSDQTWRMINWRGFGRRWSWTKRGTLLKSATKDLWSSRKSLNQSVPKSRFELGTTRTWAEGVTSASACSVKIISSHIWQTSSLVTYVSFFMLAIKKMADHGGWRALRYELPSPAGMFRSWLRIPLDSRLSVCVYSVRCVLCVGRGLANGWSHVQGVLPTVYRITKAKKRLSFSKGL
jgi:hypothetical protein